MIEVLPSWALPSPWRFCQLSPSLDVLRAGRSYASPSLTTIFLSSLDWYEFSWLAEDINITDRIADEASTDSQPWHVLCGWILYECPDLLLSIINSFVDNHLCLLLAEVLIRPGSSGPFWKWPSPPCSGTVQRAKLPQGTACGEHKQTPVRTQT